MCLQINIRVRIKRGGRRLTQLSEVWKLTFTNKTRAQNYLCTREWSRGSVTFSFTYLHAHQQIIYDTGTLYNTRTFCQLPHFGQTVHIFRRTKVMILARRQNVNSNN